MSDRVLLAITVYNGREFVPRALHSAAAVDRTGVDLDILVLDDCSPEPGFSDDTAEVCAGLGIHHYRSPRNIGIPRNFNLALATGVNGNYDYVLLCNSDVIFPVNLVHQMVRACQDPTLGSVTAFSNNVSIFSLPNDDPDRWLADQQVVDWVSGAMEAEFGGNVLDIPCGVGFCMMFPTRVIEQVGLMDPVFGRGYCEEVDWTLRSRAAGFRVGLAPGVFVYHQGGATNREAGLLIGDSTTVQEHEEIVDLRYPQFRYQLTAFESSRQLPRLHRHALARLLGATGRTIGYRVDLAWMRQPDADPGEVRCVVGADSGPDIVVEYRGFRHHLTVGAGEEPLEVLAEFFGGPPTRVNSAGYGQAVGAGGITTHRTLAYPLAI